MQGTKSALKDLLIDRVEHNNRDSSDRLTHSGWEHPVSSMSENKSLGSVRNWLEVRFQKPVTLLQLTATQLGIATTKVRHKLGFGHPSLSHQKIPLSFFGLLVSFPVEHPTHNRQAEGSSPSGPAISWFWRYRQVEVSD
jgi:hypothetical protein